jgi:hypothetical protein
VSGLVDRSVRAVSEGQSLGPAPADGEDGTGGGNATLQPPCSAMSRGLSLGHVHNGQSEGGR